MSSKRQTDYSKALQNHIRRKTTTKSLTRKELEGGADNSKFRKRTGEQHWSKVLQVNRDCPLPYSLLPKTSKHKNGYFVSLSQRNCDDHAKGSGRSDPTGGLWSCVTDRFRNWIQTKRKYDNPPLENYFVCESLLKQTTSVANENEISNRPNRKEVGCSSVTENKIEIKVETVNDIFLEVNEPALFNEGNLLQPCGISNRQLFRASLYKHRYQKLTGSSVSRQALTGTTSCPPKSAVKFVYTVKREWRSCPALGKSCSECFDDADLPFLRELAFKRSIFEGKTSADDFSISFSDIHLAECLKTGHRCKIYRGRWHGDVTVHLFDAIEKNETSVFWQNVTKLYRIRHENVILFMGACTDPPNMAVITSMPKGMSLYENIYTKKDNLNLHTKVLILGQIALGMGYLHAKGIVMRKLNTKNVFLGSKVKISVMDWGMSDIRHNRLDYASVPRGHLTYVAPEILCSIKAVPPRLVSTVPYTYETDVFAFGTVMYEVLNGDFPYMDIPVESLIWQVCKGRRQSLEDLRCSSGLKTLIEDCWAQESIYRPDFMEISKDIHKNLPTHRKYSCSEPERLHRSETNMRNNWW